MKQQNNQSAGVSAADKPALYDRIKETLAVASQLIIASPLKLPAKVVTVAKYVALALGVLEAVEGAAFRDDEGDGPLGRRAAAGREDSSHED